MLNHQFKSIMTRTVFDIFASELLIHKRCDPTVELTGRRSTNQAFKSREWKTTLLRSGPTICSRSPEWVWPTIQRSTERATTNLDFAATTLLVARDDCHFAETPKHHSSAQNSKAARANG